MISALHKDRHFSALLVRRQRRWRPETSHGVNAAQPGKTKSRPMPLFIAS
jgi:hypothetical protein